MVMPESEGVETIRKIRKLSAKVPIFAIPGGGRGNPEEYLGFAILFGANQVFEKPLEIDAFRAAIATLLEPADGPASL